MTYGGSSRGALEVARRPQKRAYYHRVWVVWATALGRLQWQTSEARCIQRLFFPGPGGVRRCSCAGQSRRPDAAAATQHQTSRCSTRPLRQRVVSASASRRPPRATRFGPPRVAVSPCPETTAARQSTQRLPSSQRVCAAICRTRPEPHRATAAGAQKSKESNERMLGRAARPQKRWAVYTVE